MSGAVGHISTAPASQALGRSVSRVFKLAAAGLTPAVRDANGHYRYRADQRYAAQLRSRRPPARIDLLLKHND